MEFDLTRDRSKANGKYQFGFFDESHKAIVPVFQRYITGEYRIIGTAFYALKPNIFITAKHIFEGSDINDDDSFYIFIEGASEPTLIGHINNYDSADIALLTVDGGINNYLCNINPLAVMNLGPEIHEIMAIFGYSHSHVDPSDTFELEYGEVQQHMRIRTKWELGGVIDIHNNGRGFVKGPCFETSVLAEGRDSGAPIFNSNGFVIGILSSSMSFESGLPNSICTSLLQLAEIPINGIPIKKLWFKERAAYCKIIMD